MSRDAGVAEALAALGGMASTQALRELTSRRAVQHAVASGAIRRPRRGLVMLGVLDQAASAACALGGVRSHLSAALHHGWEVAGAPTHAMITIPRNHHVPTKVSRNDIRLFWGRLSAAERAAGVTAPARTVVDCARVLPFADALAVADSALRHRDVTSEELEEAAEAAPRTGRSRARRVAAEADGRAANVFGSLLRGIALDVAGLHLVPQVHVGGTAFIGAGDLVDVQLGLVIEAESWTYHGGRAAFDRDVRRYTAMVRAGWIVVRFLWDDVRHRPDEVAATLADVVRGARQAA